MIGGYTKGEKIRAKINALMALNIYNERRIIENTAEIQCMVDLEIITEEQANVILNHYENLKERYRLYGNDSKSKTITGSSRASKNDD